MNQSKTQPRTDRSQLRGEIEQQLANTLAGQREIALAYGDEFANLWEVAAAAVLGGKLIRPVLMLEMAQALGAELSNTGIQRSTLLQLASALELLHYSFLLHDDVIDSDLLRRGKPNLIGTLLQQCPHPTDAALHWARTGGILMGDLMLSGTHQLFARADVDHDTRIRMLDALDHTIMESVAGEQLDVGLSDGIITPDLNTILTMTAKKTATYTFELPLRIAAILSGSSPETERVLTAAGYHLGVAFQLQDDVLSTFGEAHHHGKDPFSDLREGKLTAVIAYARMTSAWPTLEPMFGDRELTPAAGARMRQLLSDCGAERFVRGLIDEQITGLYQLLAQSGTTASLPPRARSVLLGFATELEGRQV